VIVLDANIPLEILQRRRRYAETLAALACYQDEIFYISTLSISNCMYVIEKLGTDLAKTEAFINAYHHLSVTAEDAAWAFAHYDGDDFEDALQVASAIREGCDVFLTLDSGLAKKYGSLLPIELIR